MLEKELEMAALAQALRDLFFSRSQSFDMGEGMAVLAAFVRLVVRDAEGNLKAAGAPHEADGMRERLIEIMWDTLRPGWTPLDLTQLRSPDLSAFLSLERDRGEGGMSDPITWCAWAEQVSSVPGWPEWAGREDEAGTPERFQPTPGVEPCGLYPQEVDGQIMCALCRLWLGEKTS